MKKTIIIFFGILMLHASGLRAQEIYLINSSRSSLVVQGTSSLHDWEMIADKMNAKMEVVKNEKSINDIKNVTFSIHSKDILSDNSIMNNKTQDALKSDKYQQIKFDLQSVSGLKISAVDFSGIANGNLFIAGKSRRIEVPFKGKINGNESLLITGNEKIKMSDFGITPPTAMLGTLKTGDEVTIKFELEFNK
jgi:polyisoprenoid-binding protein YceI